MDLLYVGVGSVIGALLRYWITIALKRQTVTFPYATLLINLTGAFVLGILVGLSVNHSLYLFLGTGVVGGYTTFSTMNEEMLRLARTNRRLCIIYFLLTYLVGLIVCFGGICIGMYSIH